MADIPSATPSFLAVSDRLAAGHYSKVYLAFLSSMSSTVSYYLSIDGATKWGTGSVLPYFAPNGGGGARACTGKLAAGRRLWLRLARRSWPGAEIEPPTHRFSVSGVPVATLSCSRTSIE
jgi:hypothetical protein